MSNESSLPEKLIWTKDLVSKFWSAVGKTPMNDLSFGRNASPKLFTLLEGLLPKDGRILDFGAGDGYFLGYLCKKEYRVAAYEASESRLGAIFSSGDCPPSFIGVKNSSSTETFDCVLMIEVIEHILDDDLDEVLRRVSSFIRPGGLLILTTPNNENLDLSMCFCPVSNKLFHRWQHVRSFTEDSLSGLLAQYGLSKIVSHAVDFSDINYELIYSADENIPPELPLHLRNIRENIQTKFGSETNILYVASKIA
jgi:SAM-dependent methyltransferase